MIMIIFCNTPKFVILVFLTWLKNMVIHTK